jgi:hypothetical protein
MGVGIGIGNVMFSLWLVSLSAENETEADNATKHDTDTHNENRWLKSIRIWNLFGNCILVIGYFLKKGWC